MRKFALILTALLISIPSISSAAPLMPHRAYSFTANPRSSSLSTAGVAIVVFLVLAPIVVLLVVALPLLVKYLRSRRVRRTGVSAVAKVISVKDTGTRFNYEPVFSLQVEVTPKDQPPYSAVVERVITPIDADRFSPGTMIQVKYDPNHIDRVAIVDATA